MAKATNVIGFKDQPQPFITFEADPKVAAHFQAFGEVYAGQTDDLSKYIWILYPTYGMVFENVLKYIQELEME